MYIANRGTALWAGRPRYAGSAWGDDVLLDNRGLQLDFSALAVTYLWVFVIDGRSLLATVAKFPESSARLTRIARKWTIRRAIVRAAERQCFANGVHFRGRLYAIYAKEVAQKLTERRLAQQSLQRLNRRNGLMRVLKASGRIQQPSPYFSPTFSHRAHTMLTPHSHLLPPILSSSSRRAGE